MDCDQQEIVDLYWINLNRIFVFLGWYFSFLSLNPDTFIDVSESIIAIKYPFSTFNWPFNILHIFLITSSKYSGLSRIIFIDDNGTLIIG